MKRTTAFVGATGGAGTTRLCVELGAILTHAGRDVAIFDAAFATQGLARHVPGRIDTDLTALLADGEIDPDEDELNEALIDHPVETPGRLALCPVYAPFERLARAKTVDAAKRFETLVETAANRFDHVLIDTPPVASNQAVAAVNAADSIALVAPASRYGSDAVQAMRGRLADLGTSADTVIANRAGADGDHPLTDELAIPPSETTSTENAPASAPDLDTSFSPAVALAAEIVFDTSLAIEFPEDSLLDIDPNDYLPESLS
ncbi:AAA family ATPase [Haladaptatus cibarius]|uniref:AAA family ATPase n=1 Tax=Haladaptatus cibarius TaxID=453847 RepID=UPI0006794790|nr:AAA family ATPase [Haladaptatus cibarius]